MELFLGATAFSLCKCLLWGSQGPKGGMHYALALLFTMAIVMQSGAAATVNQPSTPISSICGDCCSAGTYCASTTTPFTLSSAAGGLAPGYVFPSGSTQTCYLRDRNQPNAVDGGLCIPSGVLNITAFCSQVTTKPASLVVPTVYEANLASQDTTCSPCCDNKNMCGSGMKCVEVDGQASGGVCIPSSQSASSTQCGTLKLLDELLYCESCNSLTSSAQQLIAPAAQFNSGTRPVPGPTLG